MFEKISAVLLYHAAILPNVCGTDLEINDNDLLDFDRDLVHILNGGVPGGGLKLKLIQETLEEIDDFIDDDDETDDEHDREEVHDGQDVEGIVNIIFVFLLFATFIHNWLKWSPCTVNLDIFDVSKKNIS